METVVLHSIKFQLCLWELWFGVAAVTAFMEWLSSLCLRGLTGTRRGLAVCQDDQTQQDMFNLLLWHFKTKTTKRNGFNKIHVSTKAVQTKHLFPPCVLFRERELGKHLLWALETEGPQVARWRFLSGLLLLYLTKLLLQANSSIRLRARHFPASLLRE